jgi:hypothetical protein
MIIDFLEDGGIREGDEWFLLNLLHGFVGLDFVFFVLSEPEESSEVRVDELFSDKCGVDFFKVFFEELDFDGLLHFGESLVEEFTEGVNRLVARESWGLVDGFGGESVLDNELDKT